MSRFLKNLPRRETAPSQAEVRRAQDFWTDLFLDAILAQIEGPDLKGSSSDIVRVAGEIADEALKLKEERWSKL
jgi:hypothetical protein